MAIGLGSLRAAGRGRRGGRGAEDRGPSRSTVREVCLIGLDRPASAAEWAAGQEVAWLGRTYRVVATAGAGDASTPSACAGGAGGRSACATPRRYIHLGPGGGDPGPDRTATVRERG